MAKWEHWFWVTIFLLFTSRECRGQLDFIDTLTAPTLKPPRPRLFEQPHEKLTIITPSSIVAISTAIPRPAPVASTTSEPKKEDISVSHSVSVVSVKYSSSSNGEQTASEVTTQATTSTSQGFEAAAGLNKTNVETTTSTTTASTTTTRSPTSTTSTVLSLTTLMSRAPKAIVQPPTAASDNRLVDKDDHPHLSATTTPPVTSTSTLASTTASKNRLKYEHHTAMKETIVTQIKPIKSETARALDELGFEYDEYMDDSELLGDESNDEVIPPFKEDLDTEYFSARAIPSKKITLQEFAATSRQSKPLPPHHYEPYTIVGITLGAFLLIFIGTVGLGAFIYHERYVNKPHALDDRFSDSGGCSTSVDDSIGRVSHIDCSGLDIPTDTYCEEMYNLDNDSFLNSLETTAMPTMLWSVAPNSDSDV